MLNQEERRFIYRWFNAMLARELSDERLNALQAGEFDDFFAFLSELGFRNEIAKFQTELTAIKLMEFPRLELAADFATLFLLEGGISAMPYASAYLQDEVLSQNLAKMDTLFERFSLQINQEYNEPSDHLSIYLSLLDRLFEQGCEEERQEFLQKQLNWLPKWIEKAMKVRTKTAFYQALLALFDKFLKSELNSRSYL